MPHYLYLFLIFSRDVWFIFISTMVVATCGWSTVGSATYKSWLNKFLNLLRMVTGGSLPGNINMTPERMFIVMWLIYSLIIVTAFTSKLVSALAQEKYYPNVETFDDLAESPLPIYGYQSVITDIQKAFNGTPREETFSRLTSFPFKYSSRNRYVNWTSLIYEFCPKYHCLLNYERAQFVLRKKGVGHLLSMSKETPLPNLLSFQVPNGSPLFDQFSKYLRKVMEAGLFDFWKQNFQYRIMLEGITHPDNLYAEVVKIKALSFVHFEGAFIILVVGYISGIIAFLLEIMCFKIRQL